VPFYRFDELPSETISPHYSTAAGGTVTAAKIDVGLYRMPAGPGAAPHHHPNEQIVYILRGRVRARIGQQAQEVTAGGVIHVPADTVHEIHALEDTQFISLSLIHI